MEPLWKSRKILATKISYISQIMVYFGYIHEWAELYRQLWRDSREEWNSKSSAIFKVIMKNKDSRFKMLIKKPFTNKNANFLLKNSVYNYFSIGVLADNLKSYQAIEYFLENLEEYASFLFGIVNINISKYKPLHLFYDFTIWFQDNFDEIINKWIILKSLVK